MAGFFNNIFGQQKEVGPQDQAKRFYQTPLLTNMQQGAQMAYQAKALRDMLMPSGSSFEPIRNEALRQYRENILPNVMNQVGQRPGSSAYGQMVGRSQEDLETRLAGLRADWQERQNERQAQNARQMMEYGMKPAFETTYAPVPSESARTYLEQQKLPVTQENIQKYTPMFEPQQMLGQTISEQVQKLPETAGKLVGGYPQNVQDIQKRYETARNTQSEGMRLAEQSGLKQSTDKTLVGANPAQVDARDWILSNKQHHMPILSSNLQAQDYPFLKGVMEAQDPEIRQLAYSISNRSQLDRLYKLLEKYTGAKDVKSQERIVQQVNKLKRTFLQEDRKGKRRG